MCKGFVAGVVFFLVFVRRFVRRCGCVIMFKSFNKTTVVK